MEWLWNLINLLRGWFRDERRRSRQQRAVEYQLSETAARVRRQLVSWLDEWPANDDDVRDYFTLRATNDFDPAESRMDELGRLGGKAGTPAQDAVSRARRYFDDATRLMNEVTVGKTRPSPIIERYLQQCIDALSELTRS